VLQLSSMLGEVAWLGSGVHSTSKAAVELAMEGLALELAPIGVHVTIVVPGIFATDFAATSHRVQPDETYAPTVGVFFKEFAAQPQEAFGEPSSVVEAILTAVAADEPTPADRCGEGCSSGYSDVPDFSTFRTRPLGPCPEMNPG
jgi:NAD(P)-dependent dehydrogenase (short-subunit alcohol dehydrogenase family)